MARLTRAVHKTSWSQGALAWIAIALVSQAHASGLITLQTSNDIGVIGLLNAAVSVTGNRNSTADLGLSFNSGTVQASDSITGSSNLLGSIFAGASGQPSNCNKVSGDCIVDASDLGPSGALVAGAFNDYNAAVALTSTQSFTTISSAATINSAGNNTNVIAVSSINLNTGGNNLTLNGSAADYFILLVSGTISLTNSDSIVLTGGLTASHVLFVLTSNIGTNVVTVGSGSTLDGTVLATGTHYTIDLNGIVDGAVLNASNIVLNGGTVIGADAFAGTPEPGCCLLAVMGLAGIALLRRHRGRT